MAGAEEKTEKATPKKRRDERKKGNVFMSKDIVLIAGMLGSFLLMRMFFSSIAENARDYMVKMFSVGPVLEPDQMGQNMAVEFTLTFLKCALPMLLVAIIIPVIATGTQTRFLFATKKLAFKLSNLSPLKGIKKIFSLKNILEVLKSLLKIIILVYILYNILMTDFIEIRKTMDMDLSVSCVYMLNMIYNMVMRIVMVFFVIACLDFMYQKWDFERNMKMTKQEVKEEFKQMEGDPQIKGKIRSIQRQRALSRMMQAVPQADVIIKNPTHFAVALKYDIDKDAAPVVVAKGQDELAKRIIMIGEANGVTVIENKPLARALYASCELNGQIPEEYYGAVAEILVYVFKMNKKWSGSMQ